ncbi:hypothetical protein [Muricoccus radiodurans]|uniref:hypothetical protein n=1 Tax=Muricoccus radiodurans TaxID=2231721 RepID=UPI003CEF033A
MLNRLAALFRPGARPPPDGENPIHTLLDAAGLPWRRPRAELIVRHGIHPHGAYGWDVIPLEAAPSVLPGLILPLSSMIRPGLLPGMPPTVLSGSIWFTDDARSNLRRAEAALRPRLGEPADESATNAIARRWCFGAATLSLTAWPPELQRPGIDIPAHHRDPRLRTACHIDIETGFRPTLSEREAAWLRGFVPIASIPGQEGGGGPLAAVAAPEPDLDIIRQPPDELGPVRGRIGLAPEAEALILCTRELRVIPMERVAGFHLRRTLPARGGGGARLEAVLRGGSPDLPVRHLLIASTPGLDALDGLADALAEATGRPLEIGETDYDV